MRGMREVQVLRQFIGRQEKARFRGTRPRDWENHWASISGEHVVDREHTTRLENAVHLPVQFRFVRDVHGNMLCPYDVKRSVRKRQACRVALAVADKLGKTH